MPSEIERKFKVISDAWRAQVEDPRGTPMEQAYLQTDPARSVRIRIEGHADQPSALVARIAIKGKAAGITRPEYQYDIPDVAEAVELLGLRLGNIVAKDRFLVPAGELTWEIDVYKGSLAGLVTAEIELPSENTPIDHPEWLGEEITPDMRFGNLMLALHGLPDGWDG
jgi:adenylate cyclase